MTLHETKSPVTFTKLQRFTSAALLAAGVSSLSMGAVCASAYNDRSHLLGDGAAAAEGDGYGAAAQAHRSSSASDTPTRFAETPIRTPGTLEGLNTPAAMLDALSTFIARRDGYPRAEYDPRVQCFIIYSHDEESGVKTISNKEASAAFQIITNMERIIDEKRHPKLIANLEKEGKTFDAFKDEINAAYPAARLLVQQYLVGMRASYQADLQRLQQLDETLKALQQQHVEDLTDTVRDFRGRFSTNADPESQAPITSIIQGWSSRQFFLSLLATAIGCLGAGAGLTYLFLHPSH